MKQTAVEWLEEQLREYDFSPRDNTYLIEIPSWIWTEKVEQAKEMEKQQHQETFKQSRQAKIFEKDMPPVWESWEQYYNETYGGNK
jgi:hypothetical protein